MKLLKYILLPLTMALALTAMILSIVNHNLANTIISAINTLVVCAYMVTMDMED